MYVVLLNNYMLIVVGKDPCKLLELIVSMSQPLYSKTNIVNDDYGSIKQQVYKIHVLKAAVVKLFLYFQGRPVAKKLHTELQDSPPKPVVQQLKMTASNILMKPKPTLTTVLVVDSSAGMLYT